MSLSKLTENLNNVSNLANQPTETAEELKAVFDKAGNDIKNFLNDTLIPEIEKEYLKLSGGTLSGTINTQDVLPKTDKVYSLGSSVKTYNNVYADWLIQRHPILKGSTTYVSTAFGFVWTGTGLRVALNGDDGDNKFLVHSENNEIKLNWNGSQIEAWVNGIFVGYVNLVK